MQTAERLLNIINDRGKKELEIERVYRMLFNKEIYLLAYQNIYANEGAMTKGVNNETIDGMSTKKIENIIELLRQEKYRWKPVRRTYIEKKNGKLRPLGMPTWSDKLLQEVIRIILNAYYDIQFSDKSHGFRNHRGCHTALDAIKYKDGWKSVKWFIEGDISDCFGSIDHEILLNIMATKIKDNRFLRLIRHFLQCGYMEDWKFNKTFSGCPQEGILSPLLSNIYLDKLDQFIEKEIITNFNKGKKRANNKEYMKLANKALNLEKKGEWEEARKIRKIYAEMPSKDPNDPNFRRAYYVRYADDWLIGISGNKQDAEELKEKIKDFLNNELKLQLSVEKTLITHARYEKARFLGYDIHVQHANSKKDKRGQRIINGVIGYRVPEEVIKDKMKKYMRNGKPIHRKELTVDSDYDIIAKYQVELRGVAQYYQMAYNVHSIFKLKRAMELSLAKTLANKYKTTVNKIFKKYKDVKKVKGKEYKVLQTVVKREGKKPLMAYFGGFKISYNKKAKIEDIPTQIYTTRSQLIDRLLRDECELCGAKGNIEMHHVKKLKDTVKKHGKNRPKWLVRMIAMHRKTLAVCEKCHDEIQYGRYDGKKLNVI